MDSQQVLDLSSWELLKLTFLTVWNNKRLFLVVLLIQLARSIYLDAKPLMELVGIESLEITLVVYEIIESVWVFYLMILTLKLVANEVHVQKLSLTKRSRKLHRPRNQQLPQQDGQGEIKVSNTQVFQEFLSFFTTPRKLVCVLCMVLYHTAFSAVKVSIAISHLEMFMDLYNQAPAQNDSPSGKMQTLLSEQFIRNHLEEHQSIIESLLFDYGILLVVNLFAIFLLFTFWVMALSASSMSKRQESVGLLHAAQFSIRRVWYLKNFITVYVALKIKLEILVLFFPPLSFLHFVAEGIFFMLTCNQQCVHHIYPQATGSASKATEQESELTLGEQSSTNRPHEQQQGAMNEHQLPDNSQSKAHEGTGDNETETVQRPLRNHKSKPYERYRVNYLPKQEKLIIRRK